MTLVANERSNLTILLDRIFIGKNMMYLHGNNSHHRYMFSKRLERSEDLNFKLLNGHVSTCVFFLWLIPVCLCVCVCFVCPHVSCYTLSLNHKKKQIFSNVYKQQITLKDANGFLNYFYLFIIFIQL